LVFVVDVSQFEELQMAFALRVGTNEFVKCTERTGLD
jgi:hypothetical protein